MVDLDLSVDYMYWSIYHWHPLDQRLQRLHTAGLHRNTTSDALVSRRASLRRLRALGVRHIVIHGTYYKVSDYART